MEIYRVNDDILYIRFETTVRPVAERNIQNDMIRNKKTLTKPQNTFKIKMVGWFIE